MTWLVTLIIAVLLWNRLEDEWRLREMRRSLRRMDSEDWKLSPEPPSPHQLLGDIARPVVPLVHANRSIARAFRWSHRD